MLGVDFGGTSIRAARVEAGRVLAIVTRATPVSAGPERVLDVVAAAVRELGAPEPVGFAIPGEVDAEGRCWRLPNVPGFEDVNIRAELAARIGVPVVVENDSTTAALGELVFGHGRRHPSFLLATLGTGVGGGLAIDGRLRRGAHGFAGEIGHLRVDSSPGAPECVCGNRGCMEVFAGTLGLLRRYRELGKTATEIRSIADAADRGEPEALEVFRGMGTALGVGLAQIEKVLDLDALVFGGGISASFRLVEPSLRQALRDHAYAPPLAEVPLLVSELGDLAGVIGAAELPAR